MQRKVVEVNDADGKKQKVDLHIWDTAGQEKFFSLTKSKCKIKKKSDVNRFLSKGEWCSNCVCCD